MRHLVVCCDGTWQTIAKQTNVSRLHAAVVTPAGHPAPHYVKGAGASRNPVNMMRGGLTGADLESSIKAGYQWLAQEYRPGDHIALFGYSRGAYTARSLAGMISRVGLVDGSGLGEPAELRLAVERAYAHYRELRTAPEGTSSSPDLTLAWRPDDPNTPVTFIGVWDTVGSLGIPTYVGFPDLFGSRERYQFLDVRLDRRIPHARHAVSLDEMRGPFRPTLWRDVAPHQDVKQVWFPGDHGDVGGGHHEKGLSDAALDWMMREATSTIRLTFDRGKIADFAPDPAGRRHGERRGLVGAAFEVALQPRPRATPRVDRLHPLPDVSRSAYESQRVNGYRPTRTLAQQGSAARVVVEAKRGWTDTGLYLEPGTYRFDAVGEWRSAWDHCGPAGDTSLWHFSGSLFSRIVGIAENALRAIVRNPEAELAGTRRAPDHPWMSLIGLVANELTNADGQVVAADEHVFIGAGTQHTVRRSGYLHAFANDAWGFYGNNDGAVQLTVTRIAD